MNVLSNKFQIKINKVQLTNFLSLSPTHSSNEPSNPPSGLNITPVHVLGEIFLRPWVLREIACVFSTFFPRLLLHHHVPQDFSWHHHTIPCDTFLFFETFIAPTGCSLQPCTIPHYSLNNSIPRVPGTILLWLRHLGTIPLHFITVRCTVLSLLIFGTIPFRPRALMLFLISSCHSSLLARSLYVLARWMNRSHTHAQQGR